MSTAVEEDTEGDFSFFLDRKTAFIKRLNTTAHVTTDSLMLGNSLVKDNRVLCLLDSVVSLNS